MLVKILTTVTSSHKMTRQLVMGFFLPDQEVSFEMSLEFWVRILTKRITESSNLIKIFLI